MAPARRRSIGSRQAAAARPGSEPARRAPLPERALRDPGPGPEIRRILVDGRNVQYALARGTAGASMPTPVFVAQLRAAIPTGAKLELILDGFPSGGVTGHVSPGLDVAYSRHRSADQAIAERVRAAALELGPVGIDAILVVSDDREVGAEARRVGARAVGTAWLIDRMRAGSRLGTSVAPGSARAGTALGHGRAPRVPRGRC